MTNQILQPAPPGPAIVDADIAVGTAAAALTANQVYLYAFEINGPCTADAGRWKMGATVTGTTDMGVYNAAGALLAHTGAVVNVANTNMSANFLSSVTLAPGRYFLALCPSNGTDTYNRASAVGTGISRTCQATNAGTAGVLPSTTGTILQNGTCPVMAMHIVGGAP